MKKLAILFAGQGSQYSGMGRDFYDSCPESRAVFDAAGQEIQTLCFTGTPEELGKTEHTQPCVYTVSMAVWAAVQPALLDAGHPADGMAGFSLGECSAVTAAGLFPFTDGLEVVRSRARLMAEAADGRGGMCAVLADTETVEALAREADEAGMVIPVNYNTPRQTVVSADHAGMERFLALCEERRVRAIPLPVSGPFHSPLLRQASDVMYALLSGLPLHGMNLPVYGNLDGKSYGADNIPERLSSQIMCPVRWEATIRNMIGDGFDFFVEIGPGKTLTGFMKKIAPDVPALCVDTAEALDTLKQMVKEG